MDYKQTSSLYSLLITNVNNLIRRFGKAYFPNHTIKNITTGENLDAIFKYIDRTLPESEYNRYGGFLFPMLIFKDGNGTHRIYDGCHRYAYVETHIDVKVLAIIFEYAETYELILPTQFCTGDYDTVYELNVGNVKCSKVIVRNIEDFRFMYSTFADWLYDIIKEHDEWNFKANEIINKNSKLLDKSASINDDLIPRFQYIDENGVIRHHTIYTDNINRDYVEALYDMYCYNVWLISNDDYFNLTSSNVFDIDVINTEWWDNTSFSKESLKDDIIRNGIFFPIVYTKDENGKYRVGDGFHRYLACKEILFSPLTSDNRYLMIPEFVEIHDPTDIYVPKFIYDRYSYMIKGKIISEFKYHSALDSYVLCTEDSKSIRLVRILLERELNYIADKGFFKRYETKSSKIFNGGIMK